MNKDLEVTQETLEQSLEEFNKGELSIEEAMAVIQNAHQVIRAYIRQQEENLKIHSYISRFPTTKN